MKAEDIRNILMVAAVEEADETEIVLTAGDRHEASVAAGAPLPADPGRAREETFLAARAGILLDRVISRFPASARWLDSPAAGSHHTWLILLALATAALIGFLTNELGPEKRINILSFPLLGILAWNLVVYLREAFLLAGRREASFPEAWLERFAGLHGIEEPRAIGDAAASVLGGARLVFERRWSRLSTPVNSARLKALLHAAAFVLGASAIGGMYVKGLANEYRAVWESTFITESSQLLPLLKGVLGPAVALSGGSLPSLEQLEQIRGADSAGENAARWIHWYALTVAIFVLVPRAVLALFWRVRATRLTHTLPYRETAPRQFGRLLATSSGSARPVFIVPYAFEPDEQTKAGLVGRLEEEFAASVEAIWAPVLPFGEEEGIDFVIPEGSSEVIPLFSFAATPERETHLEVYRTLSGRSSHPVKFVLLEAAAFDRKSHTFADAGTRRTGREDAWRKLFSGEPVSLVLHPATAPSATRSYSA